MLKFLIIIGNIAICAAIGMLTTLIIFCNLLCFVVVGNFINTSPIVPKYDNCILTLFILYGLKVSIIRAEIIIVFVILAFLWSSFERIKIIDIMHALITETEKLVIKINTIKTPIIKTYPLFLGILLIETK